ncbi:MAG: Glu-tRNA(Gln) amidotransferase subunit GatE [Thermoplasmata archaeon]|nr:Glu-tRNA(Gln) amidotransferase subunit GatE [Thermoplasmata archaeon]
MKAGLEVHQQLATGKLFCDCNAELSEEVVARITRTLRATGGENHAVDAAALFQAGRGLTYHYEATPTSCLIELDEEPPHPINPEAVDVALTMALLLRAHPVDEIEVMRKIVVDGSNTAGFQRTALVAVDGSIEVGERTYSIPSICLEEDAARKVGEAEGAITFRLDRLGIPLIEIATGPEIRDGAEARAVAEAIGALLRSTRKVRRGIGSIREDLNVSIEGGSRVEIKGVQELRLIHKYLEEEAARQTALLALGKELGLRQARVPEVPPVDVTEIVRPTSEGPIATILKQGGRAMACPLPGFGGLLSPNGSSSHRLGRELADHVRAVGLRGLLHSDELPSQGIGEAVAATIRTALGLSGGTDAFVLIAGGEPRILQAAIRVIQQRAQAALEGIPPETRDPLPDGRSRYSRPLPGRDRMYPETDVPPIPVTRERVARLKASLPAPPAEILARLRRSYGLSDEMARQVLRSGEEERFELLVSKGRSPGAVARLLTQELPALAESGQPASAGFAIETLDELLRSVEAGTFAKEGVPKILTELAAGARSVPDAAARAGLSDPGAIDLPSLAEALVTRNADLVHKRGSDALGPLMGDLMREVRGRRDGQEVATALREALRRFLQKDPST